MHEESLAAIPDDKCRSLHKAKQSPEWPEWEKAIHTKLEQLKRMGTWKLIEKPSGVVVIANKFVFAKKRDKDGKLVKYKARLVAKGCAQRPGYDYVETHSPVVCMETIRVILAIAPTRKLHIQQLDVKGAYLNCYDPEPLPQFSAIFHHLFHAPSHSFPSLVPSRAARTVTKSPDKSPDRPYD